VDVDDQARALVKFSAGFGGTIEASWVASGRKMQLQFEIVGSKGAIAFSQERFSELQLFQYTDDESRNGFRTIMAGPLHPPYGEFCIAQGHQLGYNDLKTIEIRDMLWAIGGGQARGPDFREGWEVQKVIDAMILSASEHRWCTVS
jgi:predicted dehydrogenase